MTLRASTQLKNFLWPIFLFSFFGCSLKNLRNIEFWAEKWPWVFLGAEFFWPWVFWKRSNKKPDIHGKCPNGKPEVVASLHRLHSPENHVIWVILILTRFQTHPECSFDTLVNSAGDWLGYIVKYLTITSLQIKSQRQEPKSQKYGAQNDEQWYWADMLKRGNDS